MDPSAAWLSSDADPDLAPNILQAPLRRRARLVGIELDSIDDEELVSHLFQAWRLVAPKKLRAPE